MLIAAAKAQCAIPALAWCARGDSSIPQELRGYFEAVRRLNGKRNDRLCRMLEHVVASLNAIEIEPTLLKGAANLMSGLYPSPAARLVGDLDILVPQERIEDAAEALLRIGFAFDGRADDTHHHLPRMRHGETNIVVELHRRLTDLDKDLVIPADWVREHSQPLALRDLRVRIPSPTAAIGHNVIHDQINGQGFLTRVEVRQLLDLALMRARHDRDIDWAELARRFQSRGLQPVLATYLLFDEVFFGQAAPPEVGAPRVGALGQLRLVIDFPLTVRAESKARALAGRWGAYVKSFRRDQHDRGIRPPPL